MKAIIYIAILLFSLIGLSQEVFLHEVDENLSMNIPEDSVEGEMSGQTVIQGTLGSIVFTISKTDRAHKELAQKSDLSKFYEGVREGMIKASKGKLIKESITEIDNQKVVNFCFSMEVEGGPKIVDAYVFFWKKFTYTIHFMSSEIQSDTYKNSKKLILESVDLK